MRRDSGTSRRLRRAAAAWLALAAFWLAFGPAPTKAQEARASAIVIIDGSNSMNARLGGERTAKFISVREALRAGLAKVTPGTEVGLAAFGNRRASDCNDAEVIVPPSSDTGGVAAALDRYQPRGFSPVALALRTAARALPPGSGKASIVLVLDDLASCRSEDPCAVATDLKRQNPALAIHVVGLGLRPADAQVLGCVAQQTGGQLLPVTDGAGVAAAIEQALQLASLERGPPPPPPPGASEVKASRPAAPRTPAARPAEPGLPIDTSKPGLHLSARLAEGKPILLLPIGWRVWRSGETEPLLEVTATAISKVLPNGSYQVEARAGIVSVRQQIEVTSPAPTHTVLNLNGALLTIEAPLAAGGAMPSDAVLSLTDASGTADGRSRGTSLWIKRTSAADLVVPPGIYRVRAEAGLAGSERVVAAGAGTVSEIELALSAGRLVAQERTGSTVDASGASQIIVAADDPDAAGGRREIYRAAASDVDLTLPAGPYIVTLRRGTAETRERVLVKPGEVTTRPMTLPFGRVRLASRIGSGLPAGLAVRYRVERLDASMPPLQRWGDSERTIDLTPGRYRFEARIGAQNAVAAREAEIKPGLEYRVDLDPGAGGVQLKLAGAAVGLGFGDVYWQVFDEQGAAIWRTGQAEPLLALGAGRYRARVDIRDRAFERVFDVRAGDSRVIEVGG